MLYEAKRKALGILTALVVAAVWVMPNTASAQGVVMDDDDEEPEITETVSDAGDELDAGPETSWGVGLRLRSVILPRWLFEFFVEEVPSGISTVGYGLEVVRRKGDLEMSLGFEYESLNGTDGLWIDKGDSIPEDDVDWVAFDDFAWLTIDATFVWHTRLHDMVALRYGAGIGLGIMMGEVLRTDYVCPGTELAAPPCFQDPAAENINSPEDKVPPVFPVLNAVLGLQFRPHKSVSINLEAGMRTIFYTGLTGTFFFN